MGRHIVDREPSVGRDADTQSIVREPGSPVTFRCRCSQLVEEEWDAVTRLCGKYWRFSLHLPDAFVVAR
jgi:hypothetical protein